MTIILGQKLKIVCCSDVNTSIFVNKCPGPSLRGGVGGETPPYKNALSANKLSVGKMLSVGRFLLVFVQSTDAITKSKTIYHI